MLTAKMIKDRAIAAGADLCGIANVERFKDGPPETHPCSLFPETKSVIVYSCRILQGCYKGIQEGTDWSTYWMYGYGDGIYGALRDAGEGISALLDEHGHEAVPSPGGHTLLDEAPPPREPLAKGKLPPGVMLHMRVSAALAGLGEPGWAKVFLTPQFGPRQRFEILLTDAELAPDPLCREHICDKCMACVEACPGNAISRTETVTLEIAGKKIEWSKINEDACTVAFRGAEATEPREKGYYMDNQDDFKPSSISPFAHKPSNLYNTGQAICGARGCTRACMISLEERGVLKNKFKHPFRTKNPWKVDWSDYTPVKKAPPDPMKASQDR